MKDNYSFDLSEDDAKISYDKMFTAYIKTFLRLGLTPISLGLLSAEVFKELHLSPAIIQFIDQRLIAELSKACRFV